MVLLAYRHGRQKWWTSAWEQVDFKTATLHIRRAKNGTPATHPLSGREMRELRRHQRESPQSPFVFVSLPLFSTQATRTRSTVGAIETKRVPPRYGNGMTLASNQPSPNRRKGRRLCGAKTRAGGCCQVRAEPGKTRCRFHGGKSTVARERPIQRGII
ncbi:MAG TPA: HGGxSTG domain-containing protein, partial [Xanthobacteraceae bacterium]|nr:HGGxSTG domain-containing protein [Xanthobacteraceae bacterium]